MFGGGRGGAEEVEEEVEEDETAENDEENSLGSFIGGVAAAAGDPARRRSSFASLRVEWKRMARAASLPAPRARARALFREEEEEAIIARVRWVFLSFSPFCSLTLVTHFLLSFASPSLFPSGSRLRKHSPSTPWSLRGQATRSRPSSGSSARRRRSCSAVSLEGFFCSFLCIDEEF